MASSEPTSYTPEEEDEWINKFSRVVEEKVRSGRTNELDFFVITESIHLDLNSLNKEGKLMYTLWVILLLAIKDNYTGTFKYPTLSSFLAEYPRFEEESDKEKHNLWQSANWMAILFKMITARKNKGLVIQVIPKLVEGWGAKYVTGSGQTKATANRVHLFETEGNTKANQRGKFKSKEDVKASRAAASAARIEEKRPKKVPTKSYLSRHIQPGDSDSGFRSTSGDSKSTASKGRKRTMEKKEESGGERGGDGDRISSALTAAVAAAAAAESNDVTGVYPPATNDRKKPRVSMPRRKKDSSGFAIPSRLSAFGKSESMLSDIEVAKKELMRGMSGLTRDDSLGLGLDLTTSSSFLDADGNPSTVERAYSWMEIPTNTSGNERNIGLSAIGRDSSLILDNMLVRLSENVSPMRSAEAGSSVGGSSTSSAPPLKVSDAPLSADAISSMFAGYSSYS